MSSIMRFSVVVGSRVACVPIEDVVAMVFVFAG